MDLHYLMALFLGNKSKYSWVFYGVVIFLVAFIIYWLQRFIIEKLLQRAEKSSYLWDDTLLRALSLPLSLFIWICAVFIFFSFNIQRLGWLYIIPLTRNSVFIMILVFFLWRYIVEMENRLKPLFNSQALQHHIFIDSTTAFVAGRFTRIVLIGIGLLRLLAAFGIPLTGFLDKPFKLGDWIQSPDRAIEGTVNRIGWRMTEVISFENRPLYVPNALFNQIVIVNPNRMTHRKIDVSIRHNQ